MLGATARLLATPAMRGWLVTWGSAGPNGSSSMHLGPGLKPTREPDRARGIIASSGWVRRRRTSTLRVAGAT
jgi:hypothetical protein